MNLKAVIERGLTYSPPVATAIYGAIMIVLVAMTCVALVDLYTGQSELANTATLLERLRVRKAVTTVEGGGMKGSPFLDGSTVNIAAAALLQRVAGAIAKAGGTVQSSQVEVAGAQGGMVKLRVSCELTLANLQPLLYDIEAGMPFLFIDELTASMPQAVGTAGGDGNMQVQLAVSGQWRGTAR
jgi:general secretion pathway protein M